MAYNQDSAADLISRLKVGEVFSKAVFIPGDEVTPTDILEERRKLVQILSPVVARVNKKSGSKFTMHTTTGFTRSYDVVVSAVVLREEDEV
jgi:hypothetical protein